jgi:SAM-dependent methyltransferase
MEINKDWVNKNFLEIPLDKNTLQVYCVRKAIFESIKMAAPKFSGSVLDVGCGQMPYKDYLLKHNPNISKYIGLDIENSSIHDTSIADLTWDTKTIPTPDNIFDSAMATEVLEHCFEPTETLKEIYRVLKPGGFFFFTVPFLWPLHETPYDAYRYTPFSLKHHLEKAGFDEIEIKSLGGWHASMAQMLGLWVTESPLRPLPKKILIKLIKRAIPWLLRNDLRQNEFTQHSMVSGLYGFAKKITSR